MIENSHNPCFSLILATVNRIEPLKNFLDSLLSQKYKDFEVILIDQNPNDCLKYLIEEYSNKINIFYIKSLPGLSRARNLGLKQARGKFVGFPDDDCRYIEDVLTKVKHLFEYHNVDIVCGCYGEMLSENVFRMHPKYPKKKRNLSIVNFFKLVSSTALFIKRDVIESIREEGPFDEKMGAGAEVIVAEEIDLVGRLLIMGKKGLYTPFIRVEHKIFREKPRVGVEFGQSYLLAKLIRRSKNPLLFLRGVGRLIKALFGLVSPSDRKVALAKFRGFIAGWKAC